LFLHHESQSSAAQRAPFRQRSILGPVLSAIVFVGPKQWRIEIDKSGVDFADHTTWPEYHAWTLEKLNAFDRVFRERIQELAIPEVTMDDDGSSDS